MLTEVSNPSYAKNIDITNPYISPAYADLTGISPMLIIAGGDELLLDDTALVSAHAKAAGVQVTEKSILVCHMIGIYCCQNYQNQKR